MCCSTPFKTIYGGESQEGLFTQGHHMIKTPQVAGQRFMPLCEAIVFYHALSFAIGNSGGMGWDGEVIRRSVQSLIGSVWRENLGVEPFSSG